MSDSVGGASGIGGGGGGGGGWGGGVSGVSASSDVSQASAAEQAAEAMVDAVTGPTGVNVDSLGAAVADIAAKDPAAAAALQTAVEAQLSPVQVGQLQAAIDTAKLSGTVPSAVDLATTVSLPATDMVTGPFNAQGQLIDSCGNVVDSVTTHRPDALAEGYRQAVENLGRAVGGPISGPAYTAAWASGMAQPALDDFYSVAQHADGLFERQADRAESMHVPIAEGRP